ncbi:unnamed protein product [Cylicocyclus nassatus]|uniref:Uncharacterized protein n=1 Tax=Cylicocyclus nassatus TaxID=53992 RepID=A0AA36ME08_CYLNA|nr:unnamed protein product [Cylicocyclus nassatus]
MEGVKSPRKLSSRRTQVLSEARSYFAEKKKNTIVLRIMYRRRTANPEIFAYLRTHCKRSGGRSVFIQEKGDLFLSDPAGLAHVCAPLERTKDKAERMSYECLQERRQHPTGNHLGTQMYWRLRRLCGDRKYPRYVELVCVLQTFTTIALVGLRALDEVIDHTRRLRLRDRERRRKVTAAMSEFEDLRSRSVITAAEAEEYCREMARFTSDRAM